ncbi:MAG: bifunctional hydroxymethylpyrimidine kinase/phosphomethylpyrimidine kinase [Proteobacteria bacterium]|nr:bifunctional hydroxymethylpyrimidine kinase/phosphomethylpyrimidine kinase [Pseudomonadota bacterium]
MRTALTIAGSDPTGAAGIQADLQVFRSLGVHGAAVPTALVVQDSEKVHEVLPVFPSVLLSQLRVLLADFTPDAIKIGALGSDDVVRNVILALGGLERPVPVVLDPVLFASDGTPLLERRAWPSLRELCSFATLLTPNLPETEALSGRETGSRQACEAAARSLLEELGAQAVLVKGGHRDGDADDLLLAREGDGFATHWLESERLPGGPVRGTGCALSSAIAASLAKGSALVEAVEAGRAFVRSALARAEAVGRGGRFLVYP